ncbi:DUF1731 domain-containing protein, partial [Leptospira santarosai]|nr:DUF1731 domain-containing protein [Leptospira santarosai]
ETELILKSRWVLPERLENEGFQFTFDTLEKALQQIILKKTGHFIIRKTSRRFKFFWRFLLLN